MLDLKIIKSIGALLILVWLIALVVSKYDQESIMGLVLDGSVQNFIWVITGVILLEWLQEGWLEYTYGKWKVIIKHPREEIIPEPVTAAKAKNVLNEPSEKRVWIKGLMSTYIIVKCDCIGDTAKKAGLFREDKTNRRFVIDLNNLATSDGKILATWLPEPSAQQTERELQPR